MSLATRSLAVVSVGAVGLFSAVAARTQSGHAKAARAAVRTAPAPTAPAVRTAPFDGSSATDPPADLAPPPTLPAPGYQYDPAPVVSGAT